jgi:hypothetical protein
MIQLIERIHERQLRLRRIYATLTSTFMDRLYTDSTAEEKLALKNIVHREDEAALTNWIKRHSSRALEEYSYRELMELARHRKIPNYSRMIKEELLFLLKEKRR